MSSIAGRQLKVAPIFAGAIITFLLLWLLGATADVFLLLFIAIILSLYLGSVRDLLVEHAKIPPKFAFFLSIFAGIWAFYLKFISSIPFILTPLPVIAIVLFAISMQFFLMGLLAEMLVRTYHESQDKAIYTVRERLGFGDKNID